MRGIGVHGVKNHTHTDKSLKKCNILRDGEDEGRKGGGLYTVVIYAW